MLDALNRIEWMEETMEIVVFGMCNVRLFTWLFLQKWKIVDHQSQSQSLFYFVIKRTAERSTHTHTHDQHENSSAVWFVRARQRNIH